MQRGVAQLAGEDAVPRHRRHEDQARLLLPLQPRGAGGGLGRPAVAIAEQQQGAHPGEEQDAECQPHLHCEEGFGGVVNQVQPGGSGLVFGSHCAQGTSAALFDGLDGMNSPLWGSAGSDAGSLVTLPPGA